MFNAFVHSKIQTRISSGLIKYRWAVLAIALIASLLSAVFARGLRLDSNMIALLPADTPRVQALQAVLDKVGSGGDLIVMIESPDSEASIRYAKSLLPVIRELPWVEEASIGNDTSFFDRHKLLYVDLDDLLAIQARVKARLRYETLRAQPLFIDLEDAPPPSLDFSDIEDKYVKEGPRSRFYQNQDGSILLLAIQVHGPGSDLRFGKKIYNELESLVEVTEPRSFDAAMRVEVGGTFRNRIEEVETITRDVRSSSVVVGLGILLLISLYFRHPSAALAVILPLAMSLSWTFALAYLLIGALNLVTVFLIVVLLGLGIDFGIHMLARFQRERARGQTLDVAIARMLGKAGWASLIAALTTAACFFTLLLTDFRGFVEFGMIAGSGLLFSALSYFIVLPALLAIAHPWMKVRLRPKVAASGRRHERPPRVALGLCLLLVGVCLWEGRHAAFEYDLRNLRAKHPETREFNLKVREVFPDARDPASILVPDSGTALRMADALEARRLAGEPGSPIEKVVSMHSLIPDAQDAKLRILASLREDLTDVLDILDAEERAEFAPLKQDLSVQKISGTQDLPAALRASFVGSDETPGELVYVYQAGSLLDLRVAQRFAKAVANLQVDGKTYLAVSEPLIYIDMIALLRHDTPIALALATLALFALLLIDFRSLSLVLLAMLPLITGLAIMVGLMALVPLRLSLLNAVVLPSMLGLGVDGGVHMLHAVRERGSGQLYKVVRETGGAVAMCTLTSMMGFAGMLVAVHPGLRSIGALAIIGLLGCLFGAVVVLPIVLANLRGRVDK